MNIQDVKLYDTVRIKSNKCLYEYERRLIYAVTHIDMKTKRVRISSLNHKDYFISSFPDTVDIDVSDIKKVANTSNDPLYVLCDIAEAPKCSLDYLCGNLYV